MPRRKIIPSDPQDFVEIDRIVHEPARLLVLLHLSTVESADYVFLQQQTGMSWGNLSAHVRKLADVGYVKITKEFVDNKPHTMAAITKDGSAALKTYVTQVKNLIGNFDEDRH